MKRMTSGMKRKPAWLKLIICLVPIIMMSSCHGGMARNIAPTPADADIPVSPAKLTYQVGECDQSKVLEMIEKVDISFKDGTVLIEQDARYVCCAEYLLSLEQDGSTLKVIENNTGEVCRCFCGYHISAQITELPPDVRTVQVWGIYYPEMHPLVLLGEAAVP